MQTMLSYQEMKNLAEKRNDYELALHRGSAVTGNTNIAPQFAGLLNRITTYFTASSGTTLTEARFNAMICNTFATPSNLRELYVPMRLKRTVDNYTTNVQRYMTAESRRQLNLISVYESNVGVLSVFTSRYQLESTTDTTSGNSFCAIDPDYWRIGWLRPPRSVVLGKDGDRERRLMVSEMTLLARNQRAGVAGTGFVPFIPTS